MSDTSNLLQWLGHTVVDRGGGALGPVGGIYLDARSDLPKWVLVRGERGRLVPLRGATVQGDRIRVAFDAASVQSAPDLKADDDLDPEEETRLLHHYDVPVGDEGIDLPLPQPPARGATRLAPAAAPAIPQAPAAGSPARPPVAPPPLDSPAAPSSGSPAVSSTPLDLPAAPSPAPPAESHTPLRPPAAPLAADMRRQRRARRSVRSRARTAVRRNPVGLALAGAGAGVLGGLLREPAQRVLRQGLERQRDSRAGRDAPLPSPDAPAPST